MSLRRCLQCGASINSDTEALDSNVVAETGTTARYLQLMRTNEPLASPAAEMAYVRALISETGASLDSLDGEISQLRVRLKQLEDERAVLAESHRQLQSTGIASPIWRMPPEVLAEIFLWTLPSCDEIRPAWQPDGMRTLYSPWILGQISSRWREIALSTPSLWSRIYVYGSGEPLHTLRMQVQRAQKLEIHFFDPGLGFFPQIREFLFLSEHSARWEALEVDLRLSTALVPHLAALRGRLPSLRKLRIAFRCPLYGDELDLDSIDSIDCFETAPSLLDVDMTNIYPTSVHVPLPAHQLTAYRLQGPWEMHRRILKMAPNIVEARISLPERWPPELGDPPIWPETSDPPIQMLHLRHLYVSDPQILNYFWAPALAEIGLYSTGQGTLVNHLDAFILRSSCAPRRLCLEGELESAITAELLNKHPFITSLVLICCSFGFGAVNAHFNMFSTHGNRPVSFPHLREIYFGIKDSAKPIDYPLFLKMLECRRPTLSAAALLSRFGPPPDPVSLAGLNELEEEGLSLLINLKEGDVLRRLKEWTCGASWTC